MGGGQGQGGSCIYYRSPRATSFWNQSPEPSLALSVSHFCFHPCALPFCSSCRIKQPALKLHGNKDTMCKPCHMAHLASVCGSDGHTYSSVVRSSGPRRGGGGVHWSPQGAERTAQLGFLWGSQYTAMGPDALVTAFSVADHSRGTNPGSLSQTLPLTLGRCRWELGPGGDR